MLQPIFRFKFMNVETETTVIDKSNVPRYRWWRWIGFALLADILILLGLFWYVMELNQPPVNFTENTAVAIEQGDSVKVITDKLEAANVVRSSTLLYFATILLHDTTDIKASSYVFEAPLSTLEVATRLTEGDFDTDLVRFTHFEGERATQIAMRAEEVLTDFSVDRFITLAGPHEGSLYPDTYFVPADYSAEDLLALMMRTFAEEISPLEDQIASHPLSLEEVLVLASIIEREANSELSMRHVSSILQNRLEIGMALQADASIEYVLDKPLSELTPADLEIDSPYNTYLNPGLPPTPIGNPGLTAITAVLNPLETDFFYYITDNEGVFHYAETYNGHLDNIDRYLR